MEACSGAMGTAANDVGAMEPDAVDANRGDLDRFVVLRRSFSSDELDSMTGEVLS